MRFIVVGGVQGVGFRAHARAEALRLGITGYACNRPDGCVDVLACGDDAALAAFERWLQRGPPLAAVESVTREPLAGDGIAPTAFEIG